MPNPTISETITYGRISTYLVGNSNSKGNLFGGRLSAPGSMVSIAMITDALAWGQDSQSSQNVRSMANYLIWLIGMFGQQAQYIASGSGGGSVIPGGGGLTQLNFTVAASGTTLIDGQSSTTLPASWAGLNIVVNKNGQALTQITSAPVYYTWNSITRLLTVVPDAFLGDEFQITAL